LFFYFSFITKVNKLSKSLNTFKSKTLHTNKPRIMSNFVVDKVPKKVKFTYWQIHLTIMREEYMKQNSGDEPTQEWIDSCKETFNDRLLEMDGKYCDYKNDKMIDSKPKKNTSISSTGCGQTQGRYCFRDEMREKNPKISLEEMDEAWNSMTNEEQEPYKEKAREHNKRIKDNKTSDDDSSDSDDSGKEKKKKTKKKKVDKKVDDVDDVDDTDAVDYSDVPPPHPNGTYAKNQNDSDSSSDDDNTDDDQ